MMAASVSTGEQQYIFINGDGNGVLKSNMPFTYESKGFEDDPYPWNFADISRRSYLIEHGIDVDSGYSDSLVREYSEAQRIKGHGIKVAGWVPVVYR